MATMSISMADDSVLVENDETKATQSREKDSDERECSKDEQNVSYKNDKRYKEIFERICSQIQSDTLEKTALINAVRSNTDDGLLALAMINAGVDVNIYIDNSNKTALFYAAYYKDYKTQFFIPPGVDAFVTQALIAAGVDVNITDSGGETALFFAVTNKNLEVVRALIDAGADVNTVNKKGKTALFYAGKNRTGEISEALIEAGADVNITDNEKNTALFYGISSRNENMVCALVEAGADVNTPFTGKKKDKLMPLMYAILCEFNENCISALAETADLTLTDDQGETALFYAVGKRNSSAVKTLINAGVDVNVKDGKDKTALFYGVKTCRESVPSLIDAGTDVNIKDNAGKTVLFYAVQQRYVNNEGVVHTLIDAGADVKITDNEGKTALFYALQQSGSESVVRALIDAGADVNLAYNKGKTALFYAVHQRHVNNKNEGVVHTLIDAGADFKITDNEGKTALFYALQQSGSESVVRALIDAGADVNLAYNEGKTALFYAIEISSSFSSARYLLEHGADQYIRDDFNKSVLSVLVEDCIRRSFGRHYFRSYSISSRLSEGLKLFMEKGAQIQTIYEAILNVVFCRIVKHTPMSLSMTGTTSRNEDRYIIQPLTLREVLEMSKDFAIKEDRKNILEEILKMLSNFELSLLPKILDLLVKSGADPNSVDSEGNTALHYVARMPFYNIPNETVMDLCRQLKRFGIRNRKNSQHEGPLLFCLCGKFPNPEDVAKKEARVKVLEEVIRFLLKSGSSMREITHSEKFSFHLIVDIFSQGSTFSRPRPRSPDFYEYFKRRVTTKKLMHAMVRLLNLMPYKDTQVMVPKRDTDLNGVLHLWATMQLGSPDEYAETVEDGDMKFKEIMKSILAYFSQCGAKLNDRNAKEETPLHLCATWAAVELLLEAGARPNDVDALGCTPLLHAAKNKLFLEKTDCFYPDISEEPKAFWKATLEKGLDPWTADKNGESILKILLETNKFALANALVKVAADGGYLESDPIASSLLTTVCKDTSTRLHWKSILVDMILKTRMNPNPLMNNAGGRDLPLHACCANIVESEERIGRKSADNKEVTEESVHWTLSKLLRFYGGDYETIQDETGRTCLDIAQDWPPLKEFLTKAIDISEIPKFIPWSSTSAKHEHKLAKVARRQESEHVDSFWYHKEPLKSGLFGLVFAGINKNDGREVAIKRIETLRMGRREDLREISNLKALGGCEQVINYLSYFEDGTNHISYLVLELMEGSLEECLDEIPLEIEERVKHCKDVVIGLRFLHYLNILHRDLKPSNILYKTHPKLCLKIADFGLSRQINSSDTTVYGTNAGTRCWIAPEVMKSWQDHSKSSDIFACGLVLHYILSVKKHPFAPTDVANKSVLQIDNETEANMIANHMGGFDNSIDPGATHLVKSMLDTDGRRRPSAAETLCHPFFWSKQKRVNLLTAVGNQPEFECTRARRARMAIPLTAVETDLETSFSTIVKYVDWNDPGYVHMPAIYTEMTRRRSYDTHSVVELVRFIRNAYAHVSESTRPTPIRELLLQDFVFFEYFPNLVIEVYNAVTTHKWDQKREEIKYVMKNE